MGCCQSGINREEPNIESNFEGYSSRTDKENEKSNTGGDSAADPQSLGPQNSKFEETSVISKPQEKKSSGKKKKGKSKKPHKTRSSNETDKLLDQKSSLDLKISKSNFVKTTKGLLKDRYIITGKLGSGSYGNVYKAIQKSTKTLRAIKSLSKRDIKTDINKLIQEVEMLKKLDHPNIIKVIEVIEENDYMHIVTELCSGGELFDRIVSMRHFSENKAAHYMLNIMSAVAYCHQAGIVHRDLKPENLLLENEKEDAALKVIDFGESMSFGPDKKMHKRIGTCYYIAPEVLRGEYDEKCDIWSCGVILYIMLCGYPPFNGPNDNIIFERIISGQFSFAGPEWAIVSSGAKDLLMKMLTLDVKKRPSASEVLEDPWLKQRANNQLPDRPLARNSLNNFANFFGGRKLQQATLEFIACQLASSQEVQELNRLFMAMDKDKDGRLNKEEILAGYEMHELAIPENIHAIIRSCDADGSGFVDYTEFITAAMNWNSVLSEEKLEHAFSAYDTDGSGKISLEELKHFIGEEKYSDVVWEEILNEADTNGDGEIDLQEFKTLMLDKLHKK